MPADPASELPAPELVEIRRRSIVMQQPGTPALSREEADHFLGALVAALLEVRRLRSG